VTTTADIGTPRVPRVMWEVVGAVGGIMLLALCLGVRMMGALGQMLYLLVVAAGLWTVVRLAVLKMRGWLVPGWWRAPLAREVASAVLRGSFWCMAAGAIHLNLGPHLLGAAADWVAGVLAVACLVGVLGAGLPVRPTWGLTACFGVGLVGLVFEVWQTMGTLPGEPVTVAPPFRGEWAVIQGGATPLVNHHAPVPQQRGALDLMAVVDGAVMPEAPEHNADHFSWEQPLYAPGDGTVVAVVAEFEDAEGWSIDVENPAGNQVVIRLAEDRYAVLAHLRHGSIEVAEGDVVTCGQPVAKVGNTGNTTQPHLHFQVQTTPDLMGDDNRALPLQFAATTRIRHGTETADPTDLRRPDRLRVDQSAVCEK